jgi:hypothetical protein
VQHWDVISASYKLIDGSGWVHRVAVQNPGEPEQATVMMEFTSDASITEPDEMRTAIAEGYVSERSVTRFATLYDSWDAPRLRGDETDFDWASEVYHGWWYPDLTLNDLDRFAGAWSFTPELLDLERPMVSVHSMEYALSHPEDPKVEEIMTGHLMIARADLEQAEKAAVDARQRLDVAEAWFQHRYAGNI